MPLTFAGQPAVTIAPGTSMASDPLAFRVAPLFDLTVTIRFGAVPGDLTGHPGSRTTSYNRARRRGFGA